MSDLKNLFQKAPKMEASKELWERIEKDLVPTPKNNLIRFRPMTWGLVAAITLALSISAVLWINPKSITSEGASKVLASNTNDQISSDTENYLLEEELQYFSSLGESTDSTTQSFSQEFDEFAFNY